MKLSIIIVNYNVRYFLSTCLQSVKTAIENIEAEVFVVDNNSSDNSIEMLRVEFPEVQLIANNFNAGFSKANNQAIEKSKGEYILLLNPDTIVEEDCFAKCIEYLDNHSDVGGMGVKMIDGAGRFLPESKRGLPTPSVAFYKIFGLSKLFPKSKVFGKYHLGYLDNNTIAEIDVMSGAYMLMRKSVIDKIGGLDESFFMYGEDIDMSYRITEAGYKNIYFPDSKIIHFKGESTKKSTVNYVLVFYRAMIIFAKKHFSQQNASLFSVLINLAIYLRAFIALINRFLVRIYMPIVDVFISWSTLYVLKESYERIILESETYYPQEVEIMAFPILISCWIIGQLIIGGYHQPVKLKNVFKGLMISSVLVLLLYAMLHEGLRFSRAIVLLSIAASFLLIPFSRIILMKIRAFKLIRFTEINSAILGSSEEIKKVLKILTESKERKKRYYFINSQSKNATSEHEDGLNFIASGNQTVDAVKIYDIDEIIFCMKDITASKMMETMQNKEFGKKAIYLHPKNGEYLLKSSSINSIGEFILPEENLYMPTWARRKKRMFELIMTGVIFSLSPFLIFLLRKPAQLYKNLFLVLIGTIKLTGFKEDDSTTPVLIIPEQTVSLKDENSKNRVDYILNYGTEKDLELILSNFTQLDKKVS